MFQVSSIVEHFPYVGLLLLLFLGEIGLPFPRCDVAFERFLIAHRVTKLVPTFSSSMGDYWLQTFRFTSLERNMDGDFLNTKHFKTPHP